MWSLYPFLLLLTSLFTIIIPSSTSKTHNMISSELQTLYNVMETISNDKNWRISYPNPCTPGLTWPGIECKYGNDNHLHVTRLDFGTYPNPTCKTNNALTFPSQIFTLPYLQSLFFYQCFTHIPAKLTFPSLVSPSLITSPLEQLSLRSNPALSGDIPPQISTLKSLKVLTLSQNRLSGEIPLEIFRLSSLIHLDLSYNALSGSIPIELGNLRNLQGLDLSYNSLSGTIPAAIGQLGLLQKLDLSSNSIFGGIPNSIEKLNSLSFLALSNNKLKGKFPAGMTKLVNLQYFIMENNPMLITLPTELGKLVKLQELRVANCGYSGIIPNSFGKLVNLTTLSLQNNRLTGEIPAGLSELNHIYHLNLSRNFLEGVVPFNASFMKRLGKNLDLSENPGLCLDPKEESELLKSESSNFIACGNHKSYSFTQPNVKSQSSPPPNLIHHPLFSCGVLLVVVVTLF